MASIIDRFVAKVEKIPDGCWEWKAAISPDGYGRFDFGGSMKTAHNVSYTLFVAEVPKGFHVDHLCRNHSCVNPEHLEAVTPQVNILRGTGASAKHAKKITCDKGHPYQPDSLYKIKGTNRFGRRCKICGSETTKRTNARRTQIRRMSKNITK